MLKNNLLRRFNLVDADDFGRLLQEAREANRHKKPLSQQLESIGNAYDRSADKVAPAFRRALEALIEARDALEGLADVIQTPAGQLWFYNDDPGDIANDYLTMANTIDRLWYTFVDCHAPRHGKPTKRA